MSIEALWHAEFADYEDKAVLRNGGVVVLETERLFGGDSGYYYIGGYNFNSRILEAKFKIVRHDAEWESVFGDWDQQEVSAKFDMSEDERILEGTMWTGASARLKVKLTRLAELP